jgi:hypothetical protein
MPVSGYDPDDIDEDLAARLEDREIEEFLTDEEVERWESGESLLDLLDEDDIDRLLSDVPASEG